MIGSRSARILSLLACMGIGAGCGSDSADPAPHDTPTGSLAYYQCNTRADYDCKASTLLSAPDQDEMEKWLQARCYEKAGWKHDAHIRPTGPLFVQGDELQPVDDTTHHRVRIWYSPGIESWMLADRNGEIPPGEAIVKVMYDSRPPPPITFGDPDDWYCGPGSQRNGEEIEIGYSVMVRTEDASWDDWFWSIYFLSDTPSMASFGANGYGFCFTCHGSARSEMTFAAVDNWTFEPPDDFDYWYKPFPGEGVWQAADYGVAPPFNGRSEVARSAPLSSPDPVFVDWYGGAALSDYAASLGTRVTTADTVAQRFPPVVAHEQSGTPDFPGLGIAVAAPRTAAHRTMVSSVECKGCHGGTMLFDFVQPAMTVSVVQGPANILQDYAPYAEWNGSMMGLAGRDPVFHAQLECEKVRHPNLVPFLDDTCYTCHAAAGRAQAHLDRYGYTTGGATQEDPQQIFNHNMVFATPGMENPPANVDPDVDWLYGELARDGINCTVCHSVDVDPPAPGLPLDQVTTGQLSFTTNGDLFGPYPNEGLRTIPMYEALGKNVQYGKYLDDRSDVCYGCHTIHLPEVHPSYNADGTTPDPLVDPGVPKDFEQSTALEHDYSAYGTDGNNPTPCQGCHMKTRDAQGEELRSKIANIMDADDFGRAPDAEAIDADKPGDQQYEGVNLAERLVRRHTLVGLNIPTMTMFQQFYSDLGVERHDPDLFSNTNESMWFAIEQAEIQGYEETAHIQVTNFDVDPEANQVSADVCVTSMVGHKFPSGVGFRRAFIELSIVDEGGALLWQSGGTNSAGMIIDGARRDDPESPDSLIAGEYTDYFVRSQPHYEVIDRQDQAQIYEEKILDQPLSQSGIMIDGIGPFPAQSRYTYSFLSLFHKTKDNRILPKGFRMPETEELREPVAGAGVGCPAVGGEPSVQMEPSPGGPDPDYCEADRGMLRNRTQGRDCVRYEATLTPSQIARVAAVEARLFYQSLQPSWIVDKLTCQPPPENDPRPAIARDDRMTQNLYYFMSHLALHGSSYEGWKMPLVEVRVSR